MRPSPAGLAVFLALSAGAVAAATGLPGEPPNSLPVPPRGTVGAEVLDDGAPVFVVRHLDGGIDVLSALSPHEAWGIRKLVVWCPHWAFFLDNHGSEFTEWGHYRGGPAPTGLVPYRIRWRPGDQRLVVGGARAALPRGTPRPRSAAIQGHPPAVGSGCDRRGSPELVRTVRHRPDTWPTVPVSDVRRRALGAFVAVSADLLVDEGGGRLCLPAPPQIASCRHGSVVDGVDPDMLETATADRGFLRLPGPWLVRSSPGGLGPLIGLPRR